MMEGTPLFGALTGGDSGRPSFGLPPAAAEPVSWQDGLRSALQQNVVSLLCIDFDRTLIEVPTPTPNSSATFPSLRMECAPGCTTPS